MVVMGIKHSCEMSVLFLQETVALSEKSICFVFVCLFVLPFWGRFHYALQAGFEFTL